ncbi:MAG: phosphatidylglycerol lysyltransferase domain-containing protein [Candidatus Cloacimonas sp.]
MNGLNLITEEQIPLLQDYLTRFPRRNCDFNVTNLLAWGKIYHNHYLLWQDNLVIFNPQYQNICFPLGDNFTCADLANLVHLFKQEYPKAELNIVPEEYYAQHPEMDNYFEVNEDRAWADYVYEIDKLVKLSGKQLAKKKNLISQFVRAYPDYQVLPVTSDKFEVLLRFTYKWKRERSAEGIYLMTEIKAIENALKMWDTLPCEGIIICLHNKIAAFSIFSPQTENMVTEHFEKFDPEKKGAAQIVNWETARYLQNRFKYLNREQDLGLEGLRQAKLSYQPTFLVKFLETTLKV